METVASNTMNDLKTCLEVFRFTSFFFVSTWMTRRFVLAFIFCGLTQHFYHNRVVWSILRYLEGNVFPDWDDRVPGVTGVERDFVAGSVQQLSAGTVRVLRPSDGKGVPISQNPALAAS